MKHGWICLVVLVILGSGHDGFCKVDPSRVVVAEVEDSTITLEEFNLSYSIKFRANPETASHEWKADHLDRIVDRMIAAREARERGLVFDMEEDKLARNKRKMLVQELYRVYGRPDTVEIREETIRHEYEMGRFAYRIWSVMVETRAEAEEILALLDKGESFEALSKTRGKGAEVGTGGDLGWKVWRELEMVPPIRNAVVEMEVGTVSGVLESQYGFHVIKLMGKRPGSQGSYASVWKDIFANLRRERITASMTAFRGALEQPWDVAVRDEGVLLLVEKVEEANGQGVVDAVRPFLSYGEKSRILVSFKGGRWTVGEFLDYCSVAGRRIPSSGFESVARFVGKQTVNNLLVEEAKHRGLETSDGFRERMKILEEVSLESDLRKVEVEKKLRITPAMLEAYYLEHQTDFRSPEEVHLRMIVIETEVAADSVARAIREGADFAGMAKDRSLHGTSGQQGGDIGFVHRGRLGGLLDDVAFDLQVGEISRPFPYMGYWGIVEPLEKRPPRQLSLEEANPEIARILEPVERDRLTREWITGLREKYGVVVYADRLE